MACILRTIFASIFFASQAQCPFNQMALSESIFPLSYFGPVTKVEPAFESPEHARIGNTISLQYQSQNVSGSQFGYNVKGYALSFGDVIALAGDYYYHWEKSHCSKTISDFWDSNITQSIEAAKSNAALLSSDKGSILKCLLQLIKEQNHLASEALKNGKDPAQAYHETGSDYDTRYGVCVGPVRYLAVSLCSYDHFYPDAIKAYSAVHSAALQAAASAETDAQLKEAYFLEAYGQHFLTDLFSTGHLRAPRRILHSTTPLRDTGFSLAKLFNLWPGDQCCRNQHDEDCANGLWVTNALGESWAAYGDKQLLDGRSAKNRQYAVQASQMGVDEVWKTFHSQTVPGPSNFLALRKVPTYESAMNVRNFVPLFQRNVQNNASIFFRKNIARRASSDDRSSVTIPTDNSEWDKLDKQFDESGPSRNMYVFTKAFTSATKFLHLGQYDKDTSVLLASAYGSVDTGKLPHHWSMQSASSTAGKKEAQFRDWLDATSLGDGIISLVARQSLGSHQYVARHTGLTVSQGQNGKMTINIKWDDVVNDGNSGYNPGEILYDKFDTASSDLTMIKYFDNQTISSKAEAWSLHPGETSSPPQKHRAKIPMQSVNFLLAHQLDRKDTYSTLVGYGRNFTTKTGYWYFAHWKNLYTEYFMTTITESDMPAAQAVLSDPEMGRLIRIFYGQRYSDENVLRIDVVRPVRDADSHGVSFSKARSSETFKITWSAVNEGSYLLWFLSDVDGDGNKDLVGYTSLDDNEDMQVLVFRGLANGTFGAPTVSPIVLDPSKGKLMAAKFLSPIKSFRTEYTYLDGTTTAAGIMAFFDNYGVIGARIMVPKTSKGTLMYEFKGQNPSIAGQKSTTLGDRPATWMRLDRKAEAVGLLKF